LRMENPSYFQLARVRRLLRSLLKESKINCFLPRSRTFNQLCLRWVRRVRSGSDIEEQPARARAWVRPARSSYEPHTMAAVSSASATNRFSVVSLFAGAGGSCIGYQLAGGYLRVAVEFSPSAARTYRRNNSSSIVEQRNIREILAEPAGIENLLRKGGLLPGDLDILDASPPCQAFSLGGKGIGDQTVPTLHSGVWQTDSATLPFAYARIVHLAQPKVSVMENVTGLVYATPDLFDRILNALRFEEGQRTYYVNWKILSAGDYGVAQARRRVIVISIKKDLAERIGIDSDAKVLEAFPKPTHGMVSIRSAFEGLQQTIADERPYLNSIRPSQLSRLLRQLPKCPTKPKRLKNVKTNFTLVRTSWDRPAPTLVIAGQKPDGLSGAIHPELDRKFTVPELKRLFGLPDDFILTGTIEEAVQCICNMVPPLLTKAVANRIYDRVLKPLRELDG
jgi:DNA (cytosine-5)-methyltransferase 1